MGATGGTGATAGGGGGGGVGATGGSGGGTGTENCGNDIDDDANGYKDCDDFACFDDASCITKEIANENLSDHTPCGKPVTFTASESDTTCQAYSFGFFQQKCGFADFTGSVTFYCPPAPAAGAKDSVLVRWKAHGHVPSESTAGGPVLYEPLGGEYSFGNGGGSSINPYHYTFDLIANTIEADFVGYEKLSIPAGQNGGTLQEWFAIYPTVLSAGDPRIGGGFSVAIDMQKLRQGL